MPRRRLRQHVESIAPDVVAYFDGRDPHVPMSILLCPPGSEQPAQWWRLWLEMRPGAKPPPGLDAYVPGLARGRSRAR